MSDEPRRLRYSLGRPIEPGTPFVDLVPPKEAGEPSTGQSSLARELRRARAARKKAAGTVDPRRRTATAPLEEDPRARRARRRFAALDPDAAVRAWFAEHGWEPFAFQEEVWGAYRRGESGLIHAATGTGKTYAAWMGPLLEWLRDYPAATRRAGAPPLRVLWVTPLPPTPRPRSAPRSSTWGSPGRSRPAPATRHPPPGRGSAFAFRPPW